jgi:carotenoid cleavage dioxygenase
MWTERNLFLNGPFTPWRQEGYAPDLEIDGELPKDLSGALYRASVSPLYKPLDPDRHHWFDGDGMVHEIKFENGRAHYRNRYVETAALKLERQAGHALYGPLANGGVPADEAIRAGVFFKNPANTSTAVLAGKVLMFAELDVPHALNLDTLDTEGMFDFHGDVSGPVTAHFKIEPDTGDFIFFGAQGRAIKYFHGDAGGRILKRFEFDMGVSSFIHDFLITPNWAIFCINPTILNLEGVKQGQPWMVWDVKVGNNLALLNRVSGDVEILPLEGAPFAPTHWLNAYEEGGNLIIDGNVTKQMGIPLDGVDEEWDSREWMAPSRPRRWVIALAGKSIEITAPFGLNCDFPRINERYTGKKHRHGYYAGSLTPKWHDTVAFECLYKHDFETGKTETAVIEGLTAPSEPVFAPRPNSVDEDDGWIMSYWWNPQRDVSEMVVHDARRFTAAPIARVKLNNRVPLGFHASWTPAS